MKNLLKIEEAFAMVLGIYLSSFLPNHPSWWIYGLLFFLPDIGMLGYIVNKKVGAISYNIFHHKGVALSVYFIGLIAQSTEIQFWGLLLFSHSCFDRVFGYGLKFYTDFKHTHLGNL